MDIAELFSKAATKLFQLNRNIQEMMNNRANLNASLDIPNEYKIDDTA